MSGYRDWIRTARGSVEYAGAVAKYTFMAEIAHAMTRKRISRAELARRLSVTPPYVTKLLRGDVNVTIDTAVRIAHALGMRWSQHLTDAEQTVWRDVYTGHARVRAESKPKPATTRYQVRVPLGDGGRCDAEYISGA
jgi:transcriptional regulator with XRE-family HTH domain